MRQPPGTTAMITHLSARSLSSVIVDKIECRPSAVVFRARWWPAGSGIPGVRHLVFAGAWLLRTAGARAHAWRLPGTDPPGHAPVLVHRSGLHEGHVRRVGGRLTARYQRWSVPLAGLLSQIALELAGRAGRRLARALGIAVHGGTLLRRSGRAGTMLRLCLARPLLRTR
jgi:hypothetical protein